MFATYILFFFCYILALLPLCVLYVLAGVLCLVLNYLVRYRRKVIEENLINSFPEKIREGIAKVARPVLLASVADCCGND